MKTSRNIKINTSTKIQTFSNNKTIGESRLPVRSKSKPLSENQKASQSKSKENKTKKLGTISTWSILTTESDKIKVSSTSLSKIQKENRLISKIQIKSRQPRIRKILSAKSTKSNTKSLKKFQLPIHRNNSSCGKLITIDDQSIIEEIKIKSIATKNDFGADMKLIGMNNKYIKEKSNSSKSIFRLFKIKINLFREQNHMKKIKESKSSSDLSMKIPLENNFSKVLEYKILEQPFSKEFLFKLYNECRKLNKNISKLSNETNDINEHFKNFMLTDNLLRKYQNVFYNSSKKFEKFEKSFSSCNKSKSFSTELSSKNCRLQSEFRSVKMINKNLPENDGHYYHLACVLSSDPNPVNSSINNIKDRNQKLFSKMKSESINKLNNDITNVVSSKINSSISVKTSLKENENVIHRERKEFDDTLCDLDEEMKTDSSDEIKINLKDFKSPGSPSTYLTANENFPTIKSKQREKLYQSKLEPNIISSSFELPPSLSIKDFGNKVSSQMSFPDIEPPESLKPIFSNHQPSIMLSPQPPVSQCVAIFEKQFPQQMLLINSLENQSNSTISLKNQTLPKYSSSITVNCNKESKGTNVVSQNLENTRLFFNPFKPPKCNSSKFLQFLNSNNNNSTNILENVDLVDQIDLIKDSGDNDQDKNHILGDNQVVIELEEPLKRVAPMKQLLMHSRNSDKINSVFNENEGKLSPSNNSCIEKQRQKKLIRQQEQHQKAKDMAIEAARLRKERQSEIQSFDSFDSTRIVERLFTENKDIEYPEFSLYDACHFNFTKRKLRVPKPLVQSKISGILPVEPEAPSELPKSPVTYEKFRNKPIELVKHVNAKKEISKKELEKYEPIGLIKPFTNPDEGSNIFIEIKTTFNETKNINPKDKIQIKKEISISSATNLMSSSSDNSSGNSISSFSTTSSSSSESESFDSSQSISLPSVKTTHKNPKNLQSSVKEKELSEKKKLESSKTIKWKTNEKTNENTSVNKEIKVNFPSIMESNSKVLDEKLKNVKTDENINVEMDIKNNETIKANLKKENLRIDDIKFDDIFKRHDLIVKKHDMNVNTENESVNNQSNIKTNPIQYNETGFYNQNDVEIPNFNSNFGCHLNYPNKYNENLLDRTLSININVPIPDTSLSGFVQELNSQLHSLADTIDIITNRMDVFEANLIDATKYFVSK